MSNTYPDLNMTKFPDAFDDWDRYIDVTLTTLSAVTQYQNYTAQGNFEAANAVVRDNPLIKRIIINAESFNKLQDAIIAIEQFYFSDVQAYIQNLVQYKENYQPSTKYPKYSVVTYSEHDATQAYLCIRPDCPIGTPPTNAAYWLPWTARGQKGEPGTGLSPRGTWDEYVDYYKDDMVSWNNRLWYAQSGNTGVEPSVQTSTWQVAVEFRSDMMTLVDETTEYRYNLGIKDAYPWFRIEGDTTESGKIYLSKKSDLDNKIRVLSNLKLDLSGWSGKTYTLNNANVTADYCPDVLYNKDSTLVAAKAGITVESYSGYLFFSALRVPETDIRIDHVYLTRK